MDTIKKLTWQEISKIVKSYNEIMRKEELDAFEWGLDDDNTGISYKGLSHEDICKEVLTRLNNTNH